MIDLKRNLFKIDVRAQKDDEKVFMRTAWFYLGNNYNIK
ncbi:hupothetical protein [Streptococcus pyogenes]|nr:hupothetical protein [Streptococcus pyogenes]